MRGIIQLGGGVHSDRHLLLHRDRQLPLCSAGCCQQDRRTRYCHPRCDCQSFSSDRCPDRRNCLPHLLGSRLGRPTHLNNLDYEHIPVPIVTDEQTILANSKKQIEDIFRMIMGRRQGRYHVFRRLFTVAMTPLYAVMRKACITALKEHAKEPENSPLGFRELIPLTDRSIRVDDGCTGCGICVQVCPVGNIAMAEGRPVWHHRCEMCFACDEWCPKSAIHHWGRPNGAKYHHPDVKATDLIGAQNSPTS